MSTFPMSLSQTDHVPGVDIDVVTSVALFEDGQIEVSIEVHEELDLRGGHVAIAVILYGTQADSPTPIQIWTLYPVPRYGVDGKWIGTSDRYDFVTQYIDKDRMSRASHIAIRPFEAPNGIGPDIQNWIDQVSKDFNAAEGWVKALIPASGGTVGDTHGNWWKGALIPLFYPSV